MMTARELLNEFFEYLKNFDRSDSYTVASSPGSLAAEPLRGHRRGYVPVCVGRSRFRRVTTQCLSIASLGLLYAPLLAGLAGFASAAELPQPLPQLACITTDLGNNTAATTYWVEDADVERISASDRVPSAA